MFERFALACIAAIAAVTKADQPVHCLKSQVAGYWTLEVSNEALKANLGQAETICTHELPNKVQIVSKDLEFTLPGETSELYVLLKADFSVDVLDAPQGAPTGEKGDWTMIYDQAIQIELPKRNGKYLSNFRYSLKDSVEPSRYNELKTSSYDSFESRCDETMVGVKFGTDDKAIQCWVGYQTEPLTTVKATQDDKKSPLILAQTGAETKTETKTHTHTGKFVDATEADRINFAQIVNSSDLPWTADSYTQPQGLSLAQTSSTAEGQPPMNRPALGKFDDGSDKFKKALSEAQKFLKVPLKDLNADELEPAWNWEDVNGYDFTGRIIDQGKCGSCYLLATNGMLESRIKIWFAKEKHLSIQHRLDCSFVNEGCHGGWGYFDGLFVENFGAVDESCAPYEGSATPKGCARWAACPAVAGIKDTYYVGDRSYGKMTEADMLKEVRARGPINFDFNAGPEFQTYKSGILEETIPVGQSNIRTPAANQFAQLYSDSYCEAHSHAKGCSERSVSNKSQEQQGLQWAKLTHSTLIIGYGQEQNKNGEMVPYWLIRNSYGPNWGLGGNLKLRRGRNDYAGESENIAIEPFLM